MILLALVVALGFSSCTTYVVEEGCTPPVRRGGGLVLGPSAPLVRVPLNQGHCQQPMVRHHQAPRIQVIAVLHECAEYRMVRLSDGRCVRQNNPNYRPNGYAGYGGGYNNGGGPRPRYVTHDSSRAVNDPRNGTWGGFRNNPANAYLFNGGRRY